MICFVNMRALFHFTTSCLPALRYKADGTHTKMQNGRVTALHIKLNLKFGCRESRMVGTAQ
jgi:hypothetical protein